MLWICPAVDEVQEQLEKPGRGIFSYLHSQEGAVTRSPMTAHWCLSLRHGVCLAPHTEILAGVEATLRLSCC